MVIIRRGYGHDVIIIREQFLFLKCYLNSLLEVKCFIGIFLNSGSWIEAYHPYTLIFEISSFVSQTPPYKDDYVDDPRWSPVIPGQPSAVAVDLQVTTCN